VFPKKLKGDDTIKLSTRQEQIIKIIQENQPITGEAIADKIGLTRATLRPDLAVLSMCKIINAKPKVGYFISEAKSNEDLTDKLMSIKLSDVKSMPIVVNESTSVYDAIVTLFLENVGTLFVVDNKVLKGIVSRKDLLKATMGGGDLSTMPIGVIMTRVPKAVYCTEDESIIDAAEKIIEHEVDCIPIIEFDNKNRMIITGRVSKTNVTKVMLDLIK